MGDGSFQKDRGSVRLCMGTIWAYLRSSLCSLASLPMAIFCLVYFRRPKSKSSVRGPSFLGSSLVQIDFSIFWSISTGGVKGWKRSSIS
ncbi:hypothetical protein GDO81_019245 [Engystomops pustulosus]|uniref:Uncharacterized protein n=1 Tax=Engystomops pustulosus TaxID=76066 RepID=A0AAV6ZAT8_ENGPU|nr:hypothetical protein GDO81_019245 [Engystomops pustulosus]